MMEICCKICGFIGKVLVKCVDFVVVDVVYVVLFLIVLEVVVCNVCVDSNIDVDVCLFVDFV